MEEDGTVLLVFLALLLIATGLGWSCDRSALLQAALDANVARWEVDGKTGEMTLVYGCEE